jgi:radical SAM superfamily enzyme YgiQ (UPF0313 family)
MIGLRKKILFIKPPDRFLENEFVYQQLGPHYLQSYLQQHGISSDMLVLYESKEAREEREKNPELKLSIDNLNMLLLTENNNFIDGKFNKELLRDYDVAALSVMSPQAPDAYMLSGLINKEFPNLETVIGGSHPRYYQSSVVNLPSEIAFDWIVPQDGWEPMLKIARGDYVREKKSSLIIDQPKTLKDYPAPTRPLELMKRYNFNIAGLPAFHTITALGCPFTCNFCESGREALRKFSDNMIHHDMETMAKAHDSLNHDRYSLMIFDDVGLLNPKQVSTLSNLVKENNYGTWRAFTHAYLIVRYKEDLLGPFHDTGGRRIGLGLETGSQKSLDMINKRNGQFQPIQDHYTAVKIANEMGIAVDAFTMIYPWEDEQDLKETNEMVDFIVKNPVKGYDEKGRELKNHVDATIMTPYQGTKFNDMIALGQFDGVEMKENMDPGLLFYKGNSGGSGWPYRKTKLARERYEEVQAYRNSLRPKYR